MKSLKNYISEKLKVNKSSILHSPKQTIELTRIINTKLKDNVTRLDVTDIDVSKITSMVNVFYDLEDIVSIDLTGWDVSNVTDIQYMFAGCKSLKEIIGFENLDWSSLKKIDCAFEKCDNLDVEKYIDILSKYDID